MAAMTESVSLEAFLADKCDATKAKYAAELEHSSQAWKKPLDLWYADSLEFFGMLERLVKPLPRGGSRIWFRRSTRLSKSTDTQTERMAA